MARLFSRFRSSSNNSSGRTEQQKSAARIRMANKFQLRVTAGPSYDVKTHQEVFVNSTDSPLRICSEHVDVTLRVLISTYRGLPPVSPSTHTYFSTPPHTQDLYSLQPTLRFKSPVSGDALVFGNDFDLPIRDTLPPGFEIAYRIIRWGIDPGLEGDVMGDKPWIFGRALGSVNVINVKPLEEADAGKEGEEEGQGKLAETDATVEMPLQEDMSICNSTDIDADETAVKIPPTPAGRRKYFLQEQNRKNFIFTPDKLYRFDFFNPYIDFNEFSLKLPGFSINILKYWDGQPLRYVLKNRETDVVYFVILFSLVEVGEDGDGATKGGNSNDGEEEEKESEID